MKTLFVDFIKFGAFYVGWTAVFGLFGLGAYVVMGTDTIKGIFVKK